MSDGGKGSKPRPYSVDYQKYSSNWDTIFKNKHEKELNTEYQNTSNKSKKEK